MLAASHTLDSGGDGLIAFVHIIRSHNSSGAARLIHTDSDGLAIIESDSQRIGDISHRRAVFIHKAGGVDDVATFADCGGCTQDHIDLVDGVVDRGGCTVTCHFQFFEVAASGLSDLDGLGALVDEYVIGRCRDRYRPNGIARLDGDRRAVVQLQGDVSTGLVAQGGGVGDLATFVNSARCSQCDRRGVIGTRGVSHSRGDFIGPRYQIFEMFAASDAFDGGGDGLIALVDVIRCQDGNGAAGLAHPNGNALAVIQGDGERIGDISHRRAVFIHKAGGVDDVAAFADGGGGGQNDVYLIDGVVDRGGRAIACNFQLLKVAASGFSDLNGLGALVDEHVIGRCRDRYRPNGIARLDGDRRAVVQLQGDVGAGLVAQSCGVGDLTTFVHCVWRGQRDSRSVIGTRCVSHSRGDFIGPWNQILEVLAASHTLDSGGDGLVAFVHIIQSHNSSGAARLIHTDSDGLAIIESDSQRIGDISHRRAVFIHKAGGVDDVAAFANGGSGRQDDIDLVDGVVDRGGCAIACDFEFFEVAAGSVGDLDGLAALVDEYVIGRCRDRYRPNGIARLDGDRRAVVQLQGDVGARLIGERSGIGDLAAFVNGIWRSQCDRRGVIGTRCIRNGGIHRRSTWNQIFEMLAAGDAFDGRSDSLVAFIHIIRCHNRDRTAALVHADSDGLAVIQGDSQRVGDVGHRRAVFIHKAGGVNDVAAFADSGGGGQNYVDLIDGVVDRGSCAVACNFQLLKVAASGLGDLDGLGALVDEHVIGRRGDSHGADGITSLDGDARAVVQLQGDVGARLIGERSGIGDLAAFVNGIWRSQRDSRGVVSAWGIRNGGVHRGSARYQIFKVFAAGHAFDGCGDGLIAFVDIIRCNNRNASARFVNTDGDGLSVIQGDSQRIGDVGHRRAVFIHKAGGVNDVAAFADGGGGGQHHIDLVDGVVDGGGRTVACNFQFFEIAASGFGDLDGLGALVDEHVIGRCRDSHSADSIARFDRDA
ncbi:hypothetical protein PFLU3_28260 [Pseudomonas fluorescens]|uniref:Uncharacterized protein n=1 Tax=Pseudomonas fluorescens TaxID=294 RepID=A0A0D0TLI8_PSEFL|nr:hypothetical protein PFLU3_28260 [Pseudomonas fluorescens]